MSIEKKLADIYSLLTTVGQKKHLKYRDIIEIKSLGKNYGIIRSILIKLTNNINSKLLNYPFF